MYTSVSNSPGTGAYGKKKNKDFGIVYSTEHGKMCPSCCKAITQCMCRKTNEVPNGDGNVIVCREIKGRKGKGVTMITGLPLNHDSLRELAKQLKKKFGIGGSVKNGVIEIQGDHRDSLMEELKKRGYAAKRSG